MDDARAANNGNGQRTRTTRAWIVTAFNRLVLGRRYGSLSVGEVSRRAGVGRSTFYEHFRGKEDLLRHALTPILAPLADAAVGAGDAGKVLAVLDHVVENRRRTMEMLGGAARHQIEQALAELISERLARGRAHDEPTRKLEAARHAGAQIALLSAWLSQSDESIQAERVAAMLVGAKPMSSI